MLIFCFRIVSAKPSGMIQANAGSVCLCVCVCVQAGRYVDRQAGEILDIYFGQNEEIFFHLL